MTDTDSITSRELFIASFVEGRSAKLIARAMPQLVRALKDVHVRANEPLFRVGDASTSVFFIASGHVDMVRGASRTSYGERSIVGTSDVLLERARTQAAVAKSDLHALELPVISWFEILEDNAEAAMSAIAGIAANVVALRGSRPAREADPPSDGAPPSLSDPAVTSLVDRLVTLRATRAFRRARIQTLASLAATANIVRLEAGERLLAHETPRKAHYVVAQGEIETTRSSPVAKERFRASELVMGAASFARRVTFDAVATRASTVLRLADEDVFDISEDHFDLPRSILIWLEEQRDALAST